MAIEDAYQLVLEISKGAERAAVEGRSIDAEGVLKSYFTVRLRGVERVCVAVCACVGVWVCVRGFSVKLEDCWMALL